MRYDAEHKARTRDRILREAVLSIRLGGAERLGVADVMKRAGLTHGGFYAHFESREALVLSALEVMLAAARDMFVECTRGRDAREGLARYIEFYLSKAHRDAQDWGCPLPLLSVDVPRMAPAARGRFADSVSQLIGALAKGLGRLGAPEPEAAASSAVAEMIGAVSLARALGPTPESDALLATTHAALLQRLDLQEAR